MITVLSLGAGVQSTTMALMVKHGDLPPVDCAIFADTGWEPRHVYAHLDWLETVLPYPVHRVSAGDLRANTLAYANAQGRGRVAAVPWFMSGGGMGRRQCTKQYKIEPIQRMVRQMLLEAKLERAGKEAYGGVKLPKPICTMLIGISLDEAIRMKPAQVGYIVNRWPLVDKRMSRRDCLKWLAEHQYQVPGKSACIGCPYHSDRAWRDLRDNSPTEWADALAVDAAIRHQPKFKRQQFMHRSLKPLAEVDLRTHDELGQPDLFNNECLGLCGV